MTIPPSGSVVGSTARSSKLRGRAVPAGLAVVIWGVARAGDGDRSPPERPLVVTQTQVGGWFAAPWISDQVARAYGRVAGGAPVPIPLDGDHRLPLTVLLTVDLDQIESGPADCECPGGTAPPRAPDPEDLVANPEAFAQDLGGACVDLTTPNRVLEEFSYFLAVRTTSRASAASPSSPRDRAAGPDGRSARRVDRLADPRFTARRASDVPVRGA